MEALTTLPRPILYTMYNYTASLEIALTATDRAIATLSQVEAAIYRADAVFQAEIAPRILHAGIMAIHIFIQATIFTYCIGVRCGRWYRAWFAGYCTQIPVIDTDVLPDGYSLASAEAGVLALATSAAVVAPMVPVTVVAIALSTPAALPSFVPFGLLPPAAPTKPAPKPKTPRKPAAKKAATKAKTPAAGIAGRKAPTSVRVGNCVATID
jgi:hypothetical protein